MRPEGRNGPLSGSAPWGPTPHTTTVGCRGRSRPCRGCRRCRVGSAIPTDGRQNRITSARQYSMTRCARISRIKAVSSPSSFARVPTQHTQTGGRGEFGQHQMDQCSSLQLQHAHQVPALCSTRRCNPWMSCSPPIRSTASTLRLLRQAWLATPGPCLLWWCAASPPTSCGTQARQLNAVAVAAAGQVGCARHRQRWWRSARLRTTRRLRDSRRPR